MGFNIYKTLVPQCMKFSTNTCSLERFKYQKPIDTSIILRQTFKDLYEKKSFTSTIGVLDPIQAEQCAPYVKTLYCSGWQCSSNASYNPGPDLADYSYQTVPKVVQLIRRALDYRKNRSHIDGDGVDYNVPIIADADNNHGGLTSGMKLTRLFIEAGASGIHIEDQLMGAKRCGHLGGKVLVPISEHINRLKASRFQADIMDSKLFLIARTDAESGGFLSSTIDKRDHPFLLQESRTPEGYFPVRSGNEYALMRALEYAPYADMIWIETSQPCLKQARYFAEGIHKFYPEKMLAYNLSPSFNWSKCGMTDKELKEFSKELGLLGYVWQFSTIAGFHINALATTLFIREFVKNGMLTYRDKVQVPEKENNVSTYMHQKWSGVEYVDEMLKEITGGEYSNKICSDKNIENKF